MIIDLEVLKKMDVFKDWDENTLIRKVKGVEELIRKHTNNNFQNRLKRTTSPSRNSKIQGNDSFYLFNIGDTVQITDSINAGLYVVKEKNRIEKTVTLDSDLFDCSNNIITKVEYPFAIVEGAINMLMWDAEMREKVGIQSETISRHSVTYFSQDNGNQLLGYPIALTGFLKPYMKARF